MGSICNKMNAFVLIPQEKHFSEDFVGIVSEGIEGLCVCATYKRVYVTVQHISLETKNVKMKYGCRPCFHGDACAWFFVFWFSLDALGSPCCSSFAQWCLGSDAY